ncbi:ESPR domain-containing protein [Escherichia coli]|nr:ESPR domain-containing protein [Escherichia coli]MDQ9287248.1 ESPR domain-containing protein [Escherichia coli]
MKRHLNTSYRLVWNHITGTLVVASELARSRGKCAGVAYFHERRSLNNFHRDRVITFEQIAE